MIFANTLLSALMKDRVARIAITGAALVQLILVSADLPGWPCPLLTATGIRCPGCGLTAATTALVHGHFRLAMQLHAFAPLLLVSLMLIAAATLLPRRWSEVIITITETVERRTWVTPLALVAFLFYWVTRFVSG